MKRKFLSTAAAVAVIAVFAAMFSGCTQNAADTSEDMSVTAADTSAQTFKATTTETVTIPEISCFAEDETEVSPNGDVAFDDALVSGFADIIEQHNGYSFFMYDFNRDGCPEIIFYGYDMLTAYFDIYGFSGGEAVSMGTAVPGECSQNTDIDCCLELYFDANNSEYAYVSLSRYADSLGTLTDYYFQDMYRTKLSCNMKFNYDTDRCDFYKGTSEEEWYAEREKAWASLSEYELIGHINPEKMKNYTVYDPSSHDPSPRELAVTVLKEYYAESAAADESTEPEYVEVSAENEFIDFEFIEDYQGTTDIGGLADKAVDFLMTAEEYAESMEHIAEFTDKEGSDHFSDYIKDGKIIPRFNTAYPNDYDGDGRTETFIVADMPIKQGEQPLIRSFFIFADNGGHMTLLGNESDLYDTVLLDYGEFKQIIWGGFGTCGADENRCIYGVIGGQAKPLYSGRFVFCKENCFLTTHGHMSGGDFMYYDTAANEYIAIAGVEMTLDEIKAMDKEGSLADYYEGDEYTDYFFGLVGGRYYCVNYGRDITEAVFTFDGKFERVENSNVRLRFKDRYSSGETVIDIDINKAISEMKPVK